MRIILVFCLLQLCLCSFSKGDSALPIIRVIKSKLNQRQPLLDSLAPVSIKDVLKRREPLLLEAEVKELSASSQHRGMIVCDTIWKGELLGSKNLYLKDSVSLIFIHNNKPFYMISYPLFLSHNTKLSSTLI